jgi:hypothetical protein
MTDNDIRLLKENDGKVVRLHMTDGEVVTARVRFVSETEEDVIVDLLSSTMLERYEKTDVQPAFEYEFKDIAWVEPG